MVAVPVEHRPATREPLHQEIWREVVPEVTPNGFLQLGPPANVRARERPAKSGSFERARRGLSFPATRHHRRPRPARRKSAPFSAS